MAAEARFHAMGSDAHVMIVGGGAGLMELARRRIEQLEQRWSRFRPDSEVNRLTATAGTAVEVSAETVLLVRRAVDAWRLTGGSFDPTVLGAVIRAGYDRSFAELDSTRTTSSALLLGCWDIEVDDRTVLLPAGTGFDAGGIGKGLAADLVAEELMSAGADGALVNLGGDLRVSGDSPDGRGWTIAVEHPQSPEPLALVGLADGGVATSTTLRRRWAHGDSTHHHLIDPLTGESSDTDIELASVIAGTTWQAEVLAKSVLLRGSAHPFDVIGGCGAEALAVTADGAVVASDGLTAFLGDAALPRRIPDRAADGARTESQEASR